MQAELGVCCVGPAAGAAAAARAAASAASAAAPAAGGRNKGYGCSAVQGVAKAARTTLVVGASVAVVAFTV